MGGSSSLSTFPFEISGLSLMKLLQLHMRHIVAIEFARELHMIAMRRRQRRRQQQTAAVMVVTSLEEDGGEQTVRLI